ncbi:MAG: DNA recombination protein RmuC [Alphaproteobacteria bacterium]|nr:DNA recombination protein RmuC [Alphaproteobacteria bacterium]
MVLKFLTQAGLSPGGPAFWFVLAALLFAGFSLSLALGALSGRGKRARLEPGALDPLKEAIAAADRVVRDETARMRNEAEARGEQLRAAMRQEMEAGRAALDQRLEASSGAQAKAGEALRSEVAKTMALFGEGLKGDVNALSSTLKERIGNFAESLSAQQSAFEKGVGEKLSAMVESLNALARANAEAQAELKKTVEGRLDQLRAENEAKLEQMRATVDEKLQSTLEKRLGESFKHVSERLEQVHRGLGEMQTLAVGVGDLKKVLSNVKDRGGWAEVQLGALLDQMLAREQYVVNARIDPNSQQTVEFAVKLPGADNDREVLLPIDAKFPKEDYERLIAAWEAGDAEASRAALDALEKVIEAEARKISEKYIRPPYSTDFAILFLPTEGLFAEAMRRAGLVQRLQAKYKVTVAGPTTLAALLTSLQMGFRTLAIQERSSEVWEVLAEAKSEFEKYAGVWDKLAKQLSTAQNTVEEAGRRTRAVSRKLRNVESLDAPRPASMLTFLDQEAEEEDAAEAGRGA